MGAAGAGPSSPQWKTTLCKNYQEDGRYLLDICSLPSYNSCPVALDYALETGMDNNVGRCEFGGRCQFAHGQLELRTLAQNYLQLNPQVSTYFKRVLHYFPSKDSSTLLIPQYKTILCSHFAEGGSGNCPQVLTDHSICLFGRH